jgi:hypothetical protein
MSYTEGSTFHTDPDAFVEPMLLHAEKPWSANRGSTSVKPVSLAQTVFTLCSATKVGLTAFLWTAMQ